MSELRRIPLHRALYRPTLMLGGERELVLFSGSLAGGLALTALNLPAIIAGAALWLVCLFGLRMMAKADPQMSKVYMRAVKYQGYYPARSRAAREE